jgi:peptide/nickel transport system substrate-binding protein
MHTAIRGLIRGKRPLVVMSAALAVTLVACSSSSSPKSAPTTTTAAAPGASSTTVVATSSGYDPNGTLKFAFDLTGAGGPQFDPAKVTVYDSAVVIGQLLYDSLLRMQPDGSLTPALATGATVVDPQTVSVTLRAGLVFQDGTPLDASAVKFTILRNRDAKSTAFPAPINDVGSVDVNGPTSLTIHLTKPDAGAFYPLLAGLATMPVSPAAVARNDPSPVTNPLGAGPFRVKQYTPEQELLFVKSPTYWDAKDIKLGAIEYVQEAVGTPAAINALKAGAVDMVSSDISQIGALSGGGIQTSIASSPTSLLWFELCKTHKPLDNPLVRQALNYGLDRNAINQALAGGRGEPTWALVPKASTLFPSDLDNYYAYNPAKAKALLAQAGYPNGLTLTDIPSPGINVPFSEIVQQQWKQIGVNLVIKQTANVVQDVFVNHLSDVTASSVIRSGYDALNSIYTPGHLGDLCGYQDPSLSSTITQLAALPATDPQYAQLWHQAQDFVIHNALSVWGIWLPTVIGYNSNRVGGVQTIFLGVTAYPDFLTAYIKK